MRVVPPAFQGLLQDALKNHAQLPFRHGDTVEVVVDSAPVRAGNRTIGTATRGQKFEVQTVGPRGVHVDFAAGSDKRTQRGLIALEHLQLAAGAERGKGRPFLRELGRLVSETDLEVVTLAERGY